MAPVSYGGGGTTVLTGFTNLAAVAPADADVEVGQIVFWLNASANLLAFKVRNHAGAIKTGVIALT